MFICPTCNVPLSRTDASPGVFWRCPSCDGRLSALSLLRRNIPVETVNALWQQAKTGGFPRLRKCPACGNLMAEVPAAASQGKPRLDVCTTCQFVWFDAGEYAALPNLPKKASWEESLPPEAREKLALLKVRAIQEEADQRAAEENAPNEWWQWIPCVLGMPYEKNAAAVKTLPLATWSVAAIVAVVSLAAFSDLPSAIEQFGLIPAQFGRCGGLTLLTSFFIHGGLLHLVGNLYFLLIFGDNVEDWLGKGRFLLLLLLATLAGDVAHTLLDPNSTVPCIGASGGISGIIAFYALKFPRVRLGLLLRIYVRFIWINLPAYVFFLIWMAMQFFGSLSQRAGLSNVSSVAHLGGAAVGVAYWLATDWFARSGTKRNFRRAAS